MKGKKLCFVLQHGRAAKKMTETTGQHAMTLHRLLQITKVDEVNYIKEDLSIEPIDADVKLVVQIGNRGTCFQEAYGKLYVTSQPETVWCLFLPIYK